MARAKGDTQFTEEGKIIGKQQLYALLVDAEGEPILDANDNTQVIEVMAGEDGKLLINDGVDATGVSPLSGASGIRGWLSSIYKFITEVLGAKNDAAATVGDVTPSSVVALLKGILTKILGTLNVQVSGSNLAVDATIDVSANAKVSSEIDFRNFKYLSFLMPAAWDSATLTIYGSAVAGGTKVAITNDAGVAFPLMTVAVDKIYSVDVHALKLAGVHYLALVSSADQTADRTIKVMLKA